ncbi:unnamed protein product [Cuscuta campestris]|uniref:Retrotransposon Copia-like N-terminal domain-containing protein n=1 Tax=Cuscuta campestris TaxID=132261 RepID=A0A484M7H7_9ASTE|nr:unnamed protein product [Cuscuta campestris]
MSSNITKDTPVIQLHAKTHFPIKLITTNFPIWQQQVRSTLIGLDLIGYVDGTITAPPEQVNASPNPCYSIWFRQDQSIVSALLGSCTDTIQPLICNVDTARDAWLNLHSSFASASRGHVLALKSKLGRNPCGNRSINDYLHDMQTISNELALNQSPISEEDLVSHVLNQLGAEYDPISSAAFIRGSALPFAELGDVLRDFEHKLQVSDTAASSVVVTANTTQCSSPSGVAPPRSSGSNSSPAFSHNNRRGQSSYGSVRQSKRQDGFSSSCQFCSIPGHDIKETERERKWGGDKSEQSREEPAYGSDPRSGDGKVRRGDDSGDHGFRLRWFADLSIQVIWVGVLQGIFSIQMLF